MASRAPETEPRGAHPVAKAFNEAGVTVLLEEVSVAVKRGNRAAAGVQAVRARVREVAVEAEVEAEAAAVVAAEAVVVVEAAADKPVIIDAHNLT